MKYTSYLLAGGLLCLAAATGISVNNIRALENRVAVLENSLKDNSSHSDNEKEEKRELLKQTDFYKSHLIDKDTPSEKIFSANETKYILIVQDSCTHCMDIEALLYDTPNLLLDNLYIYDASQDGTIRWDEEEKELAAYYEELPEEFTLRGTPTLIRVTPDNENLEVIMGSSNIEEILREEVNA